MSDADQPLCIEELLAPFAFPHEVTGLRMVETHISWIVLTGSFAYKIKKPLQLPFIDTSTLERRRHYCEEELRLNRRLAPELYLRVVPITRAGGTARIEGDGAAIEYAVCLKQFPADAELSQLLRGGQVSLPEIVGLGEALGNFHLRTAEPVAMDPSDALRHVHDTAIANLKQLLEYTKRHGENPDLRSLWDWTRETIDAHEHAFKVRVRDHWIRDCHGDLHAGNIVRFEGRLVPFDCIDFDPGLRAIDVINDIAFLTMDLRGHGRDDLAAALLNRYLEITGDYQGVRLLQFYAVYRALVRAKVDAVAAEQSPERADEHTARMRRRVALALELTKRSEPVLLLMHGLSGSGKSWLSEQLIAPLRAIRIRSDVERKRLLGASSTTTAGFRQGNYAPELTHRVYARLMECAEHCLRAGYNVIVDAAFLEPIDRESFISLAHRLGVRCAFISCSADQTTLLNRVAARAEHGTDPSEADESVLRSQLRDFRPLDRRQYHVIDIDTRDAQAVTKTVNAVAQLKGNTESRSNA